MQAPPLHMNAALDSLMAAAIADRDQLGHLISGLESSNGRETRRAALDTLLTSHLTKRDGSFHPRALDLARTTVELFAGSWISGETVCRVLRFLMDQPIDSDAPAGFCDILERVLPVARRSSQTHDLDCRLFAPFIHRIDVWLQGKRLPSTTYRRLMTLRYRVRA